ncbi:outer membrane beta-barrel protein [Psychroserpens ponticola]|uniref:Outer membrane beta-barrel protein n=1 Tax=Psychroserpens ponticola TaxID=2932268 RepID=A0ABY7RW31_9FLAO|nr:outer membrane beta-barrel protein [Psychroserpens ponticola]WCO01343.1 outer membrane beta-barrel protein [Psychroserpens ponticola]
MTSIFKIQKHKIVAVTLLITMFSYAQRDSNKWKAQIALGLNSPSQSGFVEGFESKAMNFPTINAGFQRMFKPQFGAKLDFGFNRFSSDGESPEFKINYTRINVQFVYDPTITFLPERIGLVTHAGPGYSIVKPLGDFANNKTSFLNVMAGLEIHYAMSKRMSLYTDVSYILGLGSDFDPITEGFGSFNGNLMTITFGITFSLSGCQYC